MTFGVFPALVFAADFSQNQVQKDSESTLCPSCPLTFTHWHAYLHPLNLRCIFLPFGRFCTIVYTTLLHKYIHLMLHYIANNAII